MPVFDFPISGTIRIVADNKVEANRLINTAIGSFIKSGRAQLIGTSYSPAVIIEDFQVERVTLSVTLEELSEFTGPKN